MSDSPPRWVKLYLVPQTDHLNSMPPTVVGLLTGETQGNYILNPLLEESEEDEVVGETYVSAGLNLINKTYVWRNQILDHKPEVRGSKSTKVIDEDEDGGLG